MHSVVTAFERDDDGDELEKTPWCKCLTINGMVVQLWINATNFSGTLPDLTVINQQRFWVLTDWLRITEFRGAGYCYIMYRDRLSSLQCTIISSDVNFFRFPPTQAYRGISFQDALHVSLVPNIAAILEASSNSFPSTPFVNAATLILEDIIALG